MAGRGGGEEQHPLDLVILESEGADGGGLGVARRREAEGTLAGGSASTGFAQGASR